MASLAFVGVVYFIVYSSGDSDGRGDKSEGDRVALLIELGAGVEILAH